MGFSVIFKERDQPENFRRGGAQNSLSRKPKHNNFSVTSGFYYPDNNRLSQCSGSLVQKDNKFKTKLSTNCVKRSLSAPKFHGE